MIEYDCSPHQDPQFQKVFEFKRSHEWKLPEKVYEAAYFQIKELQDLKTELNNVKSKLNEFDLTRWSLHTQNRDVAGYVISHLKKRVKPELLTQAWCKFYEILSTFSVVSCNTTDIFRTVHLCEAPGAFVCALNHYLALNYPDIHWKWHANTLNPDYEGNLSSHMISDDRLIQHTRDHWLFGVDLTGDIQQYFNHIDIVNSVTSEKKINLVTADGSINCMIDPGEQEKLVEFLHYCETITALAMLQTGGSFVLKIFTIFEESTICLLYLLNCVFNKTFLFKPATSKSGNSELYFVCIDFNGLDTLSYIWDQLIIPYKNGCFNSGFSMFPLDDIPNSFKTQIKSCCSDFFLKKQAKTINDNIYYYLNPDAAEKNYTHVRKLEVAENYIRRFELKSIKKYQRIIPYLNVHKFSRNEMLTMKGIQCICMRDYSAYKFIELSRGKKIDMVYTSKFAILETINKLINNPQGTKHIFSLYSLSQNIITKTTTIINVNSFNLRPYYQFQEDLFNVIKASFDKEKHILFINVPFYTNFLAALWVILGSMFDLVYFDSGWCLFYKPISSKLESVRKTLFKIEYVYKSKCDTTSDLIQIFNPQVFYTDLSYVPNILKICNDFQLPT